MATTGLMNFALLEGAEKDPDFFQKIFYFIKRYSKDLSVMAILWALVILHKKIFFKILEKKWHDNFLVEALGFEFC